ncbi:MAG: aminoacetone oxidase family FAD-binding enzyme [Anaerolineae bacterium]|nr:aminoacetone oxidase family FAD-binding enzyme [Anaerolineae bacterium]
MAGIWAARTAQAIAVSASNSTSEPRILLVDGAPKLGAKILIAGGGRCNVTHDQVDESAYAGSSRNAIRKVLRRFDVPATVQFFRELGVDLKRESTGKLFPVTDSARTVLDALLRAVRDSGALIRYPYRVELIQRHADGVYQLSGAGGVGSVTAPRVILATGGKSIPKTGSDGGGYALARSLGHQITRRVFPALVPLTLPADHFLRGLSGLTVIASLELYAGSGKKIISFTDSTLCTHFGLSGPSVLDFSRYYTAARFDDPAAHAVINWLPDHTAAQVEAELLAASKTTLLRLFDSRLPERLLRALCAAVAVDPASRADTLTRDQRKAVLEALTRLPLPISGDRGFNYAEVTAGGVPLSEIKLETMESRLASGLYFCGEICDVDGRIGGYNFQWAWSSGYVAGCAAGAAVSAQP